MYIPAIRSSYGKQHKATLPVRAAVSVNVSPGFIKSAASIPDLLLHFYSKTRGKDRTTLIINCKSHSSHIVITVFQFTCIMVGLVSKPLITSEKSFAYFPDR